ncbi:MAG: cold-shock protein, partial [Planctomycetaceae bacterium]|nr:cold-shock protein [Planctomycetaceae bacterium]
KGVVKFFNNTKGFGYISDGDGDQDSSEITSRGGGVKFFNNTKGFGYISDGDGDQDSSEITSRGGGVKFFNNTKGFGYISDDREMDWLLERVAAMCGGPVTGCTFEVMDILRDIFGPN